MAYFDFYAPDDFLKQLKGLENSDEICKKILKSSVPILTESLRSYVRNHHSKTGDLWKSIKSFEPRKSKNGFWMVASAPTGRAKGQMKSGKVYARSKHGTMSKGEAIYNDDKLWFLEVGTSKQKPTPILQKATNAVKNEVLTKMQQTFEEEMINGR